MTKNDRHQYRFWRWLIISMVRIPKLYVLAWAFIALCALAVLKGDVLAIISGMLQ